MCSGRARSPVVALIVAAVTVLLALHHAAAQPPAGSLSASATETAPPLDVIVAADMGVAAPSRLVLGFAPEADAATRDQALAAIAGRVLVEIPALGAVVVAADQPFGAVATLAGDPAVLWVEPDYLARIQQLPTAARGERIFAPLAYVSDDPRQAEQWHHAIIHTDEAWRYSRGAGVLMAIIDTGVDCVLDDLAGQCVAGYDFVNGDEDPADDHGHGTDVASIAAAAARNGVAGAGVAPDARLMPLKAMGASGYGSHAAIALAVVWAVDHGARVINLSLGSYYDSSLLRQAVAYAVDHGAVVVAAVGNDAASLPTYPAAYPDVIAVAATDQADGHWQPSNQGDYVDLAAPGDAVATTTLTGWGVSSGTSEAAPIVSAVAALLLSQDPGRSPALVLERLADTAVDLGPVDWDPLFGYGRVDAAAAVAP